MISTFAHENNLITNQEASKGYLKVAISLNLHSIKLKYSANTVTYIIGLLNF
jgi:hypothetical protein